MANLGDPDFFAKLSESATSGVRKALDEYDIRGMREQLDELTRRVEELERRQGIEGV